MNITSNSNLSLQGIGWYLIACIIILIVIIFLLFVKLRQSGFCFQCLRYIKIKCLKLFHCEKQMEEDITELNEIILM